jgi:hypothetical protein
MYSSDYIMSRKICPSEEARQAREKANKLNPSGQHQPESEKMTEPPDEQDEAQTEIRENGGSYEK